MKNKVVFLVMLAVFLFATIASAQIDTEKRGMRKNGRLMNTAYLKKLDLTKDQVSKIKVIRLDLLKNIKPIIQSDLKQPEKNKNIKALINLAADDVISILTIEQRDKVLKEDIIRQVLNAGQMRKAGHFMKFLTSLNLTNSQETSIKEIIKDSAEKRKSITVDAAIDKQEKQAQLKLLRHDMNVKVRDILTPDQQKRFDDQIKEQGGF